MSKVKVWIQDLEWMRTKVSLEGEGLSFGEIYMNGRTLDLSGLTLNFDQIKTDSNNVFITSSQSGIHLNLENKQDYLYHGNIFSDEAVTMSANTDKALIFDGNIYNKEGVFRTENAKLNFQGHARIHAYVSKEQAKKLQEHGLSALTKPVSFTQEDWEDRVLF
ncbi:serine protease [Campylobacter jejuni]|nr:serine protease [Campylobacter jejuni]